MSKPFKVAFIAALAGGLFGLTHGFPLLYAAIGFVLALALSTQHRIEQLEKQIQALGDQLRGSGEASVKPPTPTPQRSQPSTADTLQVEPSPTVDPWQTNAVTQTPAAQPSAVRSEPPTPPPRPKSTPTPRPPGRLQKTIGELFSAVVQWFTGGNIFMRVGIVLLFIGVGFLINYAAGLGIITVQMRLIAIALGGVAALVIGQRLLKRKRDYALLLQGAGIGVLYLDIFGAYSIYQLIPSTLTFSLLFAVSALAAVLAVAQNAKALAYAGFAGGFLAPILASSGSGNYVGLFSYYVVLNIALLGIAWFKSWRPLNLLGFYFTFGVAALWGVDNYTQDKYANTQPFLIIFFLIYACIPILYARRQPTDLKGYVDGSLLFGTSIIAFTLQLVLVKHFEYGAAWSAFAFGAFYIVLASWLWRRQVQEERLLVEVFLALGVVFATLIIPFALGATETAGAWALEGAGLIWIGFRQNRALARWAGVALQGLAALFWVSHRPDESAQMFINASFLSGVMLAVAGFCSARLYSQASVRFAKLAEMAFILWFTAWWFGIGFREILQFVPSQTLAHWSLSFTALSAVVLSLTCLRWQWRSMWYVPLLILPVYVLAGIQQLFDGSGPLHENWGGLIWPLAIAAYYWVLHKGENHLSSKVLGIGHIGISLVLLAVLQLEIVWLVEEYFDLHLSWVYAAVMAANILALQFIHKANLWPVIDWPKAYFGGVSVIVAVTLALMIFASFQYSGEAPPLPWVPLLNPLDAVTLIGIFALTTLWLDLARLFTGIDRPIYKRVAWVCLGTAGFVWLNVTLFRGLHHWAGIRYDFDVMWASSLAQTALSILWVVIGMCVVIFASRQAQRNLWLSGGALLAIVVIKLFFEDLANTGSLERIVSFLGVGVVLILIGYFSPIPPKKAESP